MSIETTLHRLWLTLQLGNKRLWEREMIQYGNALYEYSAE